MPAFDRHHHSTSEKVNTMESIKSVKDAKAAGTAIGTAAEIAIGDTLTSKVLEVLKGLPKGKAVSLIDAFWQGFDKAAPSIRGLKRIKVTRSESVRIARGIDAGLAPVASWAESVKAAPKAEAGKGSGGGRKPRQPVAPAETFAAPVKGKEVSVANEPAETFAAPVKGKEVSVATEPANLSPVAACRQAVAVLVSLAHNHKPRLSLAFLDAVEELANVAKAELK